MRYNGMVMRNAIFMGSNANGRQFSFDNCGFEQQQGFLTDRNGGLYSSFNMNLSTLSVMRKFRNWDAKGSEFRINRIRMFNRIGKETVAEHTMSLAQDNGGVITSQSCQVMTVPPLNRIYASSYPADPSQYFTLPCAYDYTFNSNLSFRTKRLFRMDFTSHQIQLIKPYDQTFNTNNYTPVIFVEGEWVDKANSINLNFASGYIAASGFLGQHSTCSWRNLRGINETTSDVRDADDTVGVSVEVTGANNWKWVPEGISPLLGGYVDDGNDGCTIRVSSPFPKYKVIIYQATDTDNAVFNPPEINGVCYSHDGTRTGARNSESLRYGHSHNLVPVVGENMVIPDKVFTGDLTIRGGGHYGNSRGCIAALQIIEEK